MKKKNQIHKWLAWVLVVGWMGVIFYLSHQPAGESSALSAGVVQTVVAFLESIFSIQLAESELLHYIIRKGAHLFAYFVLALLVLHAYGTTDYSRRSAIMMTLIICALYAVSDEVHQLFIAGRSGQVTDVLIDTLGACIGIMFYIVIERIFRKQVSD